MYYPLVLETPRLNIDPLRLVILSVAKNQYHYAPLWVVFAMDKTIYLTTRQLR
jgi:hypothetical protein